MQAAAGVPVKVQVGGDFVLSEADVECPLIFVAGGIGITPLMAMLSHYVEGVSLRQCASCPRTRTLQSLLAKAWLTRNSCIAQAGVGQKS